MGLSTRSFVFRNRSAHEKCWDGQRYVSYTYIRLWSGIGGALQSVMGSQVRDIIGWLWPVRGGMARLVIFLSTDLFPLPPHLVFSQNGSLISLNDSLMAMLHPLRELYTSLAFVGSGTVEVSGFNMVPWNRGSKYIESLWHWSELQHGPPVTVTIPKFVCSKVSISFEIGIYCHTYQLPHAVFTHGPIHIFFLFWRGVEPSVNTQVLTSMGRII